MWWSKPQSKQKKDCASAPTCFYITFLIGRGVFAAGSSSLCCWKKAKASWWPQLPLSFKHEEGSNMNGKLGRVAQTKQECAHIKNMFIGGKAAWWEEESGRLTRGEITVYSKAGGHSYCVSMCLCMDVFLRVWDSPQLQMRVLARPIKHTSASN